MTGRHEQPQKAIAPLLEIHRSLHISKLPNFCRDTAEGASQLAEALGKAGLPE